LELTGVKKIEKKKSGVTRRVDPVKNLVAIRWLLFFLKRRRFDF
jgi:hypothetical protein